MHYEMTVKDGGGEWWPVPLDDLESEVRNLLVEFARENIGEFGYGSDETAPCEVHEKMESGCEDCWHIHSKVADDKAIEWAEKRARVLAGTLSVALGHEAKGSWAKVEAGLVQESIWIKVREVSNDD